MPAPDRYRNRAVKSPAGGENQVFVDSFGEDILGAEEEELSFLQDMGHVVVGTVSLVSYIDIADFRNKGGCGPP